MAERSIFFLVSMLAVADRAVGELAGLHAVFGDELRTQAFLVGWILVIHVKDLVARADVLGGIAVAIETPFHIQRFGFPHQGHLIDLAVARLAANALVDVDAVVEIGEVGQVVDAIPLDGHVIAEAGAHGFEDGRFGPDLRVAGHAGLGRGNAGKSTLLDGGVAVATVDAHSGDVVFVAEGNGLIDGHVDLIDEVNAIDVEDDSEDTAD